MTREPAWIPLARHALLAAIADEDQRAGNAVNSLVAEFGDQMIGPAMMLWIDVSASCCGLIPAPGQAVALTFRSDATGLPYPLEDLEPEYIWAGRMFAARIARDRDQFVALINSLSDDDERFSASVSALLDICRTEMRVRGYRPSQPLGEDLR